MKNYNIISRYGQSDVSANPEGWIYLYYNIKRKKVFFYLGSGKNQPLRFFGQPIIENQQGYISVSTQKVSDLLYLRMRHLSDVDVQHPGFQTVYIYT